MKFYTDTNVYLKKQMYVIKISLKFLCMYNFVSYIDLYNIYYFYNMRVFDRVFFNYKILNSLLCYNGKKCDAVGLDK